MPPLLGAIFLFLISGSFSEEDDGVIITSSGPIKGKRVLADSGPVTAYLGIPYAEPPLGKLRFQKPLPHKPWTEVLEATSYGSPCHQRKSFHSAYANIWVAKPPHSEDCLFLNIWVPHSQPSTPVPVIIWIHGGGFLAGASSLDLYNGASLAAAENVIVASMNYRLGILGFLFLPPEVPGNVGLWDQHLAMKWVKENAAAFGGDPAQLMLVGHSAGAASVGFHLLSPASQPLFTRAGIQSGAPNAPWAWNYPEDGIWAAMRLSKKLNCDQRNYSNTESCLRNVVNCLREVDPENDRFNLVDRLYRPVLDGEFLPKEIEELQGSGFIHNKPVLLGITHDDGSIFAASVSSDSREDDRIQTWEEFLQGIIVILQHQVEDSIVKTLALKYSEDTHGPQQYHKALVQFCKDYLFGCPMVEVATNTAISGGPVYVYSFNRHISGSLWHEWMGAVHGAEVPYLFGTLSSLPWKNGTISEADATLSRRLMRYWAEFARSGNPTGSTPNEIQWPPYNATEQNVFHISTEAPRIMPIEPAHQCKFLTTHLSNARRRKELKGFCILSDHVKNGTNATGI